MTTQAEPERRVSAAPVVARSASMAQWVFWVSVAGLAVVGTFAIWIHRDWLATSDLAWQQLVLQNLAQDPPLLGAYSRWGWSHPGPVFHYLLWVPWRLLGGSPAGMLLAMLGLHLGAVILAWLTARTRSVALAVLVAAGLLLVWSVAGEGQALLPWNPMAGLLLAGTFVVAAGDASTRGRWGVALLLPVGTVLVQAHVGTAVLVGAVVPVVLVLALLPKGQDVRLPWRTLGWSAAVTVFLWLLPLGEAFPDGGNVRAIITTDTGPGLGWGQALRAFAGAWAIPPYWGSSEVWLPESMGIPLLLVIPGAAVAVAMVRRDLVGIRWLSAGVVAALALLPSVALADQARTYVVAWAPATVVVCLAIAAWVIARGVRSGEEWVVRLAPLLVIPPALLVSLHMTQPPVVFDEVAVRAAVAIGQEQGEGVHVSIPADDRAFALTPSVVAELRRRGIEVSAQPPDQLPAGLVGVIDAEQGAHRGLLIDFPAALEAAVPAGWEVAVEEDPFTAQEWRDLARYRAQSVDPGLSERDRSLALLGYEQVRAGRTAWRILLEDRP